MITYDPRSFDLNALKESLKGKTILIVGHSNTTPAMVNTLLANKTYDQIDDANNGNLYIVTIIDASVTSNLLFIN